jgi:hypothetical protein
LFSNGFLEQVREVTSMAPDRVLLRASDWLIECVPIGMTIGGIAACTWQPRTRRRLPGSITFCHEPELLPQG